ncbi:hypothetical protein NUM_07180 [Actinocatenispora comari]|jgi:hypothetical protein|uniref:Uncharacterized protein n=1 Tax=Actinocatenispora comari TaxID=2807577 RepID=A0A8J4EJ19_9ACTN|nr:hypothetical protein NUM_07180 [Actinocatenispora comari]
MGETLPDSARRADAGSSGARHVYRNELDGQGGALPVDYVLAAWTAPRTEALDRGPVEAASRS